MVRIKQLGDGATYDTKDYPYVLINKSQDRVTGRFSKLEKAHKGRLMEQLNNKNDVILLMNEQTKKFIDWRKKENMLYQKYKNNPSKYFEKVSLKVKPKYLTCSHCGKKYPKEFGGRFCPKCEDAYWEAQEMLAEEMSERGEE